MTVAETLNVLPGATVIVEPSDVSPAVIPILLSKVPLPRSLGDVPPGSPGSKQASSMRPLLLLSWESQPSGTGTVTITGTPGLETVPGKAFEPPLYWAETAYDTPEDVICPNGRFGSVWSGRV